MTAALTQVPVAPEIIPYEELLANRKQGKELLDTKWQLRNDGSLTQLPNPAAGGSTNRGMLFLNSVRPAQKGLDEAARILRARDGHWANSAPWIAPLLRHPGNLLGATFAEHHFVKLGREVGTEHLRQFLLQPDVATGDPLVRREQLDRELAVRLLMTRNARAARGELQALAERTDDPFLRLAAQQALAAFGVGKAPKPVALTSLNIAVPAKSELWIFLDTSKLLPASDPARSVRRRQVDKMWDRMLRAGSSMADIHLAGAQHLIDIPEELPYELARAWGRAHVDQCLLAIQPSGDGHRLAWAAASGAFETSVLHDYLSRLGVKHSPWYCTQPNCEQPMPSS